VYIFSNCIAIFIQGACNCDDLEDGTILNAALIVEMGQYECKRIEGQKCTKDSHCYPEVTCWKGICTCSGEVACFDKKLDIKVYDLNNRTNMKVML